MPTYVFSLSTLKHLFYDEASYWTFIAEIKRVMEPRSLFIVAEAKEDDDVEFLQDREEAIGDRKAVVLDGSNFLGALKCQDDFGCVHYEPKGEPER